MLVPYRGEGRPGSLYTFDDASIGTQVDPDFILSSCQVIPGSPHSEVGSQVLLVYSRLAYFPQSGMVFGESAPAAGAAGNRTSRSRIISAARARSRS